MTSMNSEYELKHWRAKWQKNFSRAKIMEEMFPYPMDAKIVADIGCGPLCGIFGEAQFPSMYAVDPLWDEYFREQLYYLYASVTPMCAAADSFKLPEPADLIFSFNALDHSGTLKENIQNVMNNLAEDGVFCFHIHLRSKDQLNAGHKMVVTEEELDEIFDPYKMYYGRIVKRDPFLPRKSKKKYRAYMVMVSNQRKENGYAQ